MPNAIARRIAIRNAVAAKKAGRIETTGTTQTGEAASHVRAKVEAPKAPSVLRAKSTASRAEKRGRVASLSRSEYEALSLAMNHDPGRCMTLDRG